MQRAFTLILLSACLLSCESKEERADRQDINATTDSLAATGEHGYFVATYIVGRFKTSRMQHPYFQVEVGHMDERLLGSPIALQLVDSLDYQLSYSLAGEQKTAKGEYNAMVLGKDFSLRFALDSMASSALHNLMVMDYELRVYQY
ncbi:MAG TPA: hypothetical protein PK760_10415 [Flavobacteriales bacterium]|nr:hypothetical protein [Flavobacteriales bacterium]